jgi:hypothetical protein
MSAETEARRLAAALWPDRAPRAEHRCVSAIVGQRRRYEWVVWAGGSVCRTDVGRGPTEAAAWVAAAAYLTTAARARLAEIDALATERARLADALGLPQPYSAARADYEASEAILAAIVRAWEAADDHDRAHADAIVPGLREAIEEARDGRAGEWWL